MERVEREVSIQQTWSKQKENMEQTFSKHWYDETNERERIAQLISMPYVTKRSLTPLRLLGRLPNLLLLKEHICRS